MNSLTLAYLGDNIYETYVRKHLVDKGIVKVSLLQKEASKYSSAKGQASFVKILIEKNFFIQEELDVYYRGRNAKSHTKPKNTDIVTYKIATGLEAMIGYLYINDQHDRIKKIMEEILGE